MSEISKYAMKLLTDLDFIDMRIKQQDDYIQEKLKEQHYTRGDSYLRLYNLIESARYQQDYFKQLRELILVSRTAKTPPTLL